MTLRIGITGGIGSGKTTVCRLFEILGVPVYYADDWAKWLLNNDPSLRQGILDIFGDEAYDAAGQYNRAYIAGVVFEQPKLLSALNALAHPAVETHSNNWQLQHAAKGLPYTLKEAALLFESGSHRHLDRVVVVTAPEELRIQRVQQRDGLSETEVRRRIARQMPETEKIALAQHLIQNDGTKALIPQVWALHRAWCNLANPS